MGRMLMPLLGVSMSRTRRQFIRDLGLSAAAVPFVLNLPGMAFANQQKAASSGSSSS